MAEESPPPAECKWRQEWAGTVWRSPPLPAAAGCSSPAAACLGNRKEKMTGTGQVQHTMVPSVNMEQGEWVI